MKNLNSHSCISKWAIIDGSGAILSYMDTYEQAENELNFYKNVWQMYGVKMTNNVREIIDALKEEVNSYDDLMEFLEILAEEQI